MEDNQVKHNLVPHEYAAWCCSLSRKHEIHQVNKPQCRVRVLPDAATLPDHEVLQESLATRTMNAARVRAAILDVIGAGAEPACGRVPWLFWTPDMPENNEIRLDFCDRVQQRIEELEKVGLP